MNIRVELSNSIGTEGRKAIEENAKGLWMFTTIGWGFTWSGSYKQACLMARKSYSQLYETNFGTITLTGHKPNGSCPIQLELDI